MPFTARSAFLGVNATASTVQYPASYSFWQSLEERPNSYRKHQIHIAVIQHPPLSAVHPPHCLLSALTVSFAMPSAVLYACESSGSSTWDMVSGAIQCLCDAYAVCESVSVQDGERVGEKNEVRADALDCEHSLEWRLLSGHKTRRVKEMACMERQLALKYSHTHTLPYPPTHHRTGLFHRLSSERLSLLVSSCTCAIAPSN